MHLNGSSQTLQINTSNFGLSTDITLSFWFKKSSSGSSGTIFHFSESDGNNKFVLWDRTSNKYEFTITGGTGHGATPWPVAAGNWMHVVVTPGKLYCNGSEISTHTMASLANCTYNFMIGADRDGTAINDYLNGSIDQLRIFNRTLTQSEVTALYNEE